VLFIFIGSLLFLIYGQLPEKLFAIKTAGYVRSLKEQGVDVTQNGMKLFYNLRKHVAFDRGSAELSEKDKEYLRKVAGKLTEAMKLAGSCSVVVKGTADSHPYPNDPFGNWSLSARRALAVLRFLHECHGCGYSDDIKRKLTLLGEGDIAADPNPNDDDRRVDLIIDCTRERSAP
jgi:flagellar motor protein MotB